MIHLKNNDSDMQRYNFVKTVLLTAMVALLTSCHSHKYSVKDLTGAHPEKARFESVVDNSFGYEALQSKVKYQMGGSSLNGKLCLESGKRLCLLVNAPIVGFEVARVEASQQQVLLVDKLDKVYSQLQLADLYQIEDISGHEMEVLECIMLGRIYIPGKGQASSRDFASLAWSTAQLADGTQGTTQGVYQGKNYSLTYVIDSKGLLQSTSLKMGDKQAQWLYDGYQEVAKGRFVPTRETIIVSTGSGEPISAGLVLNAPEIGESTWRDFEVTSSYREVTASELLDIIKKMAK